MDQVRLRPRVSYPPAHLHKQVAQGRDTGPEGTTQRYVNVPVQDLARAAAAFNVERCVARGSGRPHQVPAVCTRPPRGRPHNQGLAVAPQAPRLDW